MSQKFNITKSEKAIYLILMTVPVALLSLGIYHGLMQTLYRSGMVAQTSFAAIEYYQGLTLHGVINAVVLTTFFAVAFGFACMSYYLKMRINTVLAWSSTIVMTIGTLMAAVPMLIGKASVLYTFYPPLKAHPMFYAGVATLVVGSWIAFYAFVRMYMTWKKDNKDIYTPLPVVATIANFTIWFVCTIPAAYELIFMLIPWSSGMIPEINIPLARTLFWFFGHALVYFWLLPAYTMFYAMLPKIAGGKLYSENAGRLVFFLFMILSIPVGVHHQFGDPSITRGVKMVQSILTFGIAVPSFITAFTIAASLEYASFKRTGKNTLLSWWKHLPYFDTNRYLFAYLICGLFLFIFGGLTGLVNASYSLNNMVHNTAFLPGHFHMTVAGPVFLAIAGMILYMSERVSGKKIRLKRFATVMPYMWTVGMFLFSFGLMWGGLRGEPRRTNMGISYLNPESPLFRPDWVITTGITVLGGVILFVAAVLFFVAVFDLMLSKKSEEAHLEFPVSESYHKEPQLMILDRFTPWVVVMIFVIFVAYIPAFRDVMNYTGTESGPFDPNNPIQLELYQKGENE